MKRTILTLISIACFHLLHAQNPTLKQWDYRFGGTGQEFITSFQQTTDGGYIIGGYSLSDSSGDKTEDSKGTYDYWIIKINSFGIKEWDKDFGGSSDDRLYSLEQTTDGGYILGGTSSSGVGGDKTESNWDSVNFSHDFWVIKIDSVGNKEWDKTFGGTANDYMVSVEQTIDGGYILGGNSVSGISGDKTESNKDSLSFTYDFWVVKIDSAGHKQWDKDLGGTDNDASASVEQTTDGGYLLAGTSLSGISGDKTEANKGQIDYWIIKINSQGIPQWDKDFGGSENDILYSMQYTTDGGSVLAGVSASGISGDKTQPNWDNSNSSSDYWVVKIDSVGVKQWDKTIGGTIGEPRYGIIRQTMDGGYLASGISYSSISGNKTENNLGIEQTWVVKTDTLGMVQWDKTIFTTSEDECGFAIQTADGCYLMANNTHAGLGGYKTQDPWGSFEDFWLVKFCDSASVITEADSYLPPADEVSLFPNPTSGSFTILLPEPLASSANIMIYDLAGKLITGTTLDKQTQRLQMDLSHYAAGMYVVKIVNRERNETLRVNVMK